MDSLDRRKFLLTAGAATLTAPLAAVGPPRNDGFGGFRLGAQSYTFREFNLEQALTRMQRLGIRYGEFFPKHCPQTNNAATLRTFLRTCGDFGVTPYSWGVQRFTKDHDANQRVFEFAAALGLKMLSADPDPDSFDSLDKLCARFKIAIGIHPHGPEGPKRLHRWWSSRVILNAIKDRHELVGTCLDTGHLIRCAQVNEKLDPASEVRAMGRRNFGLHLKDHDNRARRDVVFGKGSLDVLSVLRALRAVRFDGLIAIEYEHMPKEPSADVRDCITEFRAAVRRLS